MGVINILNIYGFKNNILIALIFLKWDFPSNFKENDRMTSKFILSKYNQTYSHFSIYFLFNILISNLFYHNFLPNHPNIPLIIDGII